jgi:ATP-binding cassette subfamily B protein
VKRLETLVDPFVGAGGAPPQSLWAYGRWALRGAGPAILALALLSILAGVAEVVAAGLVGWVVDRAAG